jgi:hypothetical protein
MSSEDGGVCTVSSSVRRALSSRGTFAAAAVAAFGTEVCIGAGLRAVRARAARFGAADLRLTGRFLAVRFADRRAGARLAVRRAGLARFATFFAFELFRFAIASILSEP